MDKKFEKVNKLLTEESFLKKLETVETDEGVQKLFSENGVDLTLDEIDQMCKESVSAHESEEISEENLESVSGGLAVTTCFLISAASLGFYSGYGFRRFTRKKK